jgi:hypothetical protein
VPADYHFGATRCFQGCPAGPLPKHCRTPADCRIHRTRCVNPPRVSRGFTPCFRQCQTLVAYDIYACFRLVLGHNPTVSRNETLTRCFATRVHDACYSWVGQSAAIHANGVRVLFSRLRFSLGLGVTSPRPFAFIAPRPSSQAIVAHCAGHKHSKLRKDYPDDAFPKRYSPFRRAL